MASELGSPSSPRVSDLNLSDYYTIAAVLDQSPDDGNDVITSFSNPNYGLDAINSNLFMPPSYPGDNENNEDDANIDNAMPSAVNNTGSLAKNPFRNLTDNCAKITANYSEPADALDARRVRGMLKKTSTGSVPNSDEDEEDEEDGRGFGSIVSTVEAEDSCGSQNVANDRSDKDGSVAKQPDGKKDIEADESLGKTTMLKSESKEHSLFRDIYSPDSNDSGIQADVTSQTRSSPGDATGHRPVFSKDRHEVSSDNPERESSKTGFTSNIYQAEASTPLQPEMSTCDNGSLSIVAKDAKELVNEPSKEVLPRGWQKHEDSDGAYYWHIKSGTIQREPPSTDQYEASTQQAPTSCKSESVSVLRQDSSFSVGSNSITADAEMLSNKRTSILSDSSSTFRKDDEACTIGHSTEDANTSATYPMRFAVRSLGWVQISEEDLTPERSSRSVNKCIVGLSLGKNDLNDVVGRWGDGKSLYMELDEENLVLIDPQDMCILNIQPIHSIRVWGVGRSNGRFVGDSSEWPSRMSGILPTWRVTASLTNTCVTCSDVTAWRAT